MLIINCNRKIKMFQFLATYFIMRNNDSHSKEWELNHPKQWNILRCWLIKSATNDW